MPGPTPERGAAEILVRARPDRASVLNRVLGSALTLLIITAGLAAAWFEARNKDRMLRSIILSEARMLAESLDIERVRRLTGTAADTASPDYQSLRNQLKRMRSVNSDYRYMYLFGRRAGEPFHFLMGTAPEDSPDYSPPGLVYYEESPTLEAVYATHEARVSPPFTDRWGTWVSALTPLLDPETGSLLAIAGIDVDARDWNRDILFRASTPIVLTLFALAALLALFAFVRNRGIVREKEIIAAVADELEHFFNVVPELLCIGTRDGRLLKANRAWTEILGYAPSDLEALHFLDIVHESERGATRGFLETIDDKRPIAEQTLRCRCKDGTYRSIAWRAQSHGGVIYAAASDVTERLRMEEQLRQAQKMEAIGQLAGGVAHDFNNLLQAILGFATLMERDVSAEGPGAMELKEILKATYRAIDLTRQLLAFSRRQVLDIRAVNLNQLVEELMQMLRRLLGEHIEVKFVPGPNLGVVEADFGQVEQIVMNLCVNARDAMPNGGRLIIETSHAVLDETYTRIHTWAKPGNYAVLSVTDTGCGMDAETLEHIFEPFFTTKEVGKGTGLGLATIYGIVRQHNGLVHVYSEKGRGTRFHIYLPVREAGADEAQGISENELTLGQGETLLLAEDQEQVRDFLKEWLERAGYRVLTASDGESAIEIHRAYTGRIDCLILDVVMPKMGGLATYQTIDKERPGIGCLFASGYSAHTAAHELSFGGRIPLLQKPYHPNDLLRKLRTALDGASQKQAAPLS